MSPTITHAYQQIKKFCAHWLSIENNLEPEDFLYLINCRNSWTFWNRSVAQVHSLWHSMVIMSCSRCLPVDWEWIIDWTETVHYLLVYLPPSHRCDISNRQLRVTVVWRPLGLRPCPAGKGRLRRMTSCGRWWRARATCAPSSACAQWAGPWTARGWRSRAWCAPPCWRRQERASRPPSRSGSLCGCARPPCDGVCNYNTLVTILCIFLELLKIIIQHYYLLIKIKICSNTGRLLFIE